MYAKLPAALIVVSICLHVRVYVSTVYCVSLTSVATCSSD